MEGENKEHYVCTTCGGVSGTPGVCTTEGCTHKGQTLQTCTCNEDEHKTDAPEAPSTE